MNASYNIPISAIEIAKVTIQEGFYSIPAEYYQLPNDLTDILEIQQSYFSLKADPNGGRKLRSQASFTYKDGEITLDPHREYVQAKEDNYEQNGRPRMFAPLDLDVMNMPLFKHLIQKDLEIAKNIAEVDFSKEVEIGIHQIRYAPIVNQPSFSSPRWLHKDTEETVFIHLFNLTSNVNGGQNIISYDAKFQSEFQVVRLIDPLDTLLVNRKHFHAVIPLTLDTGRIGYRDVLLVTFNNRKTNGK